MTTPKIGTKLYLLIGNERGSLVGGVFSSRALARAAKAPDNMVIDIPLGPNQQRKLQKSLERG